MSLSAIFILICDPYEVYSIGFQLSYAAVFFISWLSPVIMKYLKTRNKKVNVWAMEPLSVTLAAQAGTLPFVLYYFHQFSLLSIPANIFIIPYTFVVTYSSLVEIFVIFLPTDYQFFYSLFYDLLIQALICTTQWVSSVDSFMFKNIPLSLWELIPLIFALIFVKYFLFNPRIKTIYPFLICLVIFQMNRLINEYRFSHKKNFVVFYHKDVLLGFREGKRLLVMKDIKSSREGIKTYVVDPYVTGERINEVEYRNIGNGSTYEWENKKIQILNQNNTKIFDSADYMIISDRSRLNLEKNGFNNVILTGNVYFHEEELEKEPFAGLWITSIKGAFTTVP
jgi:competence protein ComEC